MTECSENNLAMATGCLGMLPNRAGMSFIANQLVMERMSTGATVMVSDKGRSAEPLMADIHQLKAGQAQRVMRIGCKRNDKSVAQVKAEPYYRQFAKQR